MNALADALDLPCDYFLRPLKFQMETVRFRKKERVSGKMEKRIEQVASDLIESLYRDRRNLRGTL